VGHENGCTLARPSVQISFLPDLPSSFPTMGERRYHEGRFIGSSKRFERSRRDRRGRVFYRRELCSRQKRGGDVGKSCAGRTTKVMAIADRDGLPLAITIAPGNRHDSILTQRTLEAAFVDKLAPRMIGDKAWDNKPLQEELANKYEIELIAPLRGGKRPSQRKQDGRSLRRSRRRWKVERLFAWLKRYRRIATRWERKSVNYLGFLHLGCIMILLRHF